MNTQLEAARNGRLTSAMKAAAEAERMDPQRVLDEVARGHAVLPANPAHAGPRPAVVGRAFRTKVNANIGRSTERSSLQEEQDKLRVALAAGADFIMDLSVGPDLPDVRKAILAACPTPLGTVPIYEALCRADRELERLDIDLLLAVIAQQAEQGVDFMTLHAGILRSHVELAVRRTMGIVSRGGSMLAEWKYGSLCICRLSLPQIPA